MPPVESIANRWFRCVLARPEAPLRLYCLPYAGGGPAAFRAWGNALPNAEVWAVHLPGRESRLTEPAFDNMNRLLDALTPLLIGHVDRPYCVFGHSMGAMIAFETACRLDAMGQPIPEHLFVSSHPAPGRIRTRGAVHLLSDAAFVERLRSFEGTPKEVFEYPELLELLIPILRADFRLLETHYGDAGRQVASPITAFGGLADPEVNESELMGWQSCTIGAFKSQRFEGSHFYWQRDPAPLMDAIESALHTIAARVS